MYEIEIVSENLSLIPLDEVKLWLRQLGYTPEDSLIQMQIDAAIKDAEQKCNRTFTEKVVTVRSDKTEFYLLGVLDSKIAVSVKINDAGIAGYTIVGTVEPYFTCSSTGVKEVTYSTVEAMPAMVREYVKQRVGQLYERDTEVVKPDESLLNPYKNMVWLI